jgi:hypothetical protein
MPEMTSATGPSAALASRRGQTEVPPVRRRWTLALAGLGAFMSALDVVVATAAGWVSAEVRGSLAAGVILMLVFIAWEQRARYPMLPLAYFRRRGFATANGVIFFQFISH